MSSILSSVFVGLIVAAAMLITLGNGAEARTPSDDPWVLVSYDPDQPYGTYLGNGFISTRILGDGVGSQDGKPLSCYMSGLYDGPNIVATPTWSDLRFYDGDTQFKIDKDVDYRQVLDMKAAVLTTYATWRAGEKTLIGQIEVIISRSRPNIGLVRAEFIPNYDGAVSVPLNSVSADNMLKVGGSGKMQNFPAKGLSTSVSRFINKDNEEKVSLAHTIVPSETVQVNSGCKFSISSWTALSNRAEQPLTEDFALSVNNPDAFISDHIAAWAKLWQKDIVIEGCAKDQQVMHACIFYLLQSVREGDQWSIPPMGLCANTWAGHIFWDADTWMFPALILQHPELAKSIVDFRYNTLPQAIVNAKAGGYKGAEYAWKSTNTGKEGVASGLLFSKQRHITGDVALAQWQYYLATGDLDWLKTRGYPIIKATADYWVSRVEPKNSRYEITQVMPPDEDAGLVDNNAYTNAIAKMNLEIASQAAMLIGDSANPEWRAVAEKIYIPINTESKRFIAFDNYENRTAKQADSELLVYPLQFDLPEQEKREIYRNTFDFYGSKMSRTGPAYSWSAHSVIEARFGERDKAYSAFRMGFDGYLRGPFNYLNETANMASYNMCYITACAGPMQAVLFGLVGAHMDYFPQDLSKVELTFSPCLPKQWKSMKITCVQWHGKVFDVSVTEGDKVSVLKSSSR